MKTFLFWPANSRACSLSKTFERLDFCQVFRNMTLIIEHILCSIGNIYIFQSSIFPLPRLTEGTGFCAAYFALTTGFVKWKGSTKACQVGVPLHLVLKEGEAFVPPIFGELLRIF